MSTKIKICGLCRPQDADAVNRAGPDYAGFVFYEKSRRYVTPEQARGLRLALHPGIVLVGVFVDAPEKDIAALYREGTISVIQLHGGESGEYINRLRAALPGAAIWKAFTIRSAADIAAALRSPADLVLLDHGGGSGRRFDWSLIEGFPRPFILAGGLTPDNIPEAAARFHPYAVDLSSGVEDTGRKDAQKIFAAVAAARGS